MKPRTQHILEERIHQVLAEAIRRDLSDPRVELALPSITQVKLAPDLSIVHVKVSILGEEGASSACWKGLLSARKFLQGCLAKHLQIRTVPQLVLHLDDSLKKAAEVLSKINEAMKDIRPAPDETQPAPSDAETDP